MKSFAQILNEMSELDQWRPVGGQLGSNDGGLFAHPVTGDRYYVKHYRNPEQHRTEVLTSKIFDHMGIKTTNPEVRTVNGREGIVSPWNPDLSQMHHAEFRNLDPEQRKQIGRMYHGAVLTKNWDMVGLMHDNILRHKTTNDLYSIDQGAGFHFRAQGGHKDYDPEIGEHRSLRHNDQASGDVFHHVLSSDPEAYRAGHEATDGIDMDHVHHLFAKSGIPDWRGLHSAFVSRRDKLLRAKNQ